jgi:hypothetical protein
VPVDDLAWIMGLFHTNLCSLFAKPLDNFKWIFIILNRLKQLDGCNIEDRCIWSGVDRRTYSIQDVIKAIDTKHYSKIEGDFFCTLLFLKDHRDVVLNELSTLVDNCGGEFENFPFQQFQFSNKHELRDKSREIMRFDSLPEFEDIIRNRDMTSLMRDRKVQMMMQEFDWIELYGFID